MIAEGKYEATILAFTLRNATVKGKVTQVLDLTANVKGEGPVRGSMFLNDDDADPVKGYKSSRDRSFDTLRRLGWDGRPDGQFSGLVGKPANIEVAHKVNGGKTFAEVKYFNAPAKSSVDPAAAAALFGASVKPFIPDEDIPF